MPSQSVIDFMNVYGSAISLLVGVLAIWLSIMFYRSAKNTEIKNTVILAELKQNISTLNSINNSLLSKAMQHMADSQTQITKEAFNMVNLSAKENVK